MTKLSDQHDAVVGRTMARIARGGTASLFGAAATASSAFIVVIVVTRLYDPADAGALFAAISVFLILVAIVELGVDQGFVRFIAWYRARAETGAIPAVLRAGYAPVVVMAIVATAVGVLIAAPLAELFAGEGDTERVATMIRVLCCAVPVAAVYEVTLAATRGYGSMKPTVLIEQLMRPLLQPIAVGIAAALGTGLVGLATAWAAPYLVGLVAAGAALRRARRSAPPRGEDPRTPRSIAIEFWRFTAARGLARVCQVALQRVDVVLVAALRGPRDAAIYTAVTRFLVVGQVAMHAVQQVIQPRLAELLAVENYAAASVVFKRATAWFVAMAWPLFLVIAIYAGILVGVFGAAYQDGATSLTVLSLAMLAATAAGPVDVLLLMSGRSGLSLINTATALVVDIVLCVLLVPEHGVLGAAIAWAAAIIVRNALGIVQVRVHLQMTAVSPALGRIVVITMILFGVAPFALAQIMPGLGPAIAVVAISGVTYLASLWLSRDIMGFSAFSALVSRRSGRHAANAPAPREGQETP